MRYLLLSVFFLCSYQLTAQTGTTGTLRRADDVNFTELANYYHAHPNAHVRKQMFDEDGDKVSRPERAGDPANERLIHRAPAPAHGTSSSRSAYLPASPVPADSFQSSVSDFTAIPPDTHGSVDSNYCVSAINDSITIRTRAGGYVSGASLDDFWSSLETFGTGAYDPRVHYDPHYNRWIMVADCYGESVNSTIFIAVSETGDPTGTWHMFSLYAGDAAGDWLDFPCVGFNSKWIAVSGNIFSSAGSYNNDVLYIFNYAEMRATTGSPTYTELLPASLDPNSFCIAPALTYDTAEQNLYGMEIYNGSSGKLAEWKVSGTVDAPVLSLVGNPTTTTHWKAQGAGGSDFAPQLGTTDKLQTNDDRINNLQQRNGTLWCAHNAFLPATGTVTHCAAMWWEIDTTGTPLQNGLLTDASTTDTKFYAFPSIAVNSAGDALMGFAYFSDLVHPSGAYTLHLHTDPSDSMRPVEIFRHGQKTYFQNFGGSDDRWGDYSGTCIDPRNNLDFWTIQESVPNYSGDITNSIWDTWWAYVQVCATLAAPSGGSASATQCTGTAATYTVAAVTGATAYTWTVAGAGWSGSSTTTSLTLTAGTGVATVTAAANNSCGPGTPYTFTVTGISTPPTPAITAVTMPCLGAATATFSATATAATSYSWSVLGAGWSGTSTTSSITTTVGTAAGTIIATGTNACGSSQPDTLTVTPGAVPSAATAIDTPIVICSGGSVSFTTPAVTGATSYTWAITGTGWSGSSTSSSITATAGSGPATITVTPVNSCGSGTPFTLTGVAPVITPTVTFTVANHITTTDAGDVLTYTGTSIPGAVYTWAYDGGTATPGGSSTGIQTVTWPTTGLKTVTLSVTNNGCSSSVYTDTVLVNFPAAVAQLSSSQLSESILPNPNEGTFEILFSKAVNRSLAVKMTDIQGRIVYKNKFASTTNNKLEIVTQGLPAGTYTVSIDIDEHIITDKVTVIK